MAGHDTLNVGTVVRPHPSEPLNSMVCLAEFALKFLSECAYWAENLYKRMMIDKWLLRQVLEKS